MGFVQMADYIPKKDTQQKDFLKKYPEYDGRGCLIAIIDTGVDVSLPGFQKTSTGLPKIVDCIDFTKEGNIETSTIKEIDKNNTLIGLTGRELKIPQNWKNPSGKWHLGKKSYHELCQKAKYQQKKETVEKNQNIVLEKIRRSTNIFLDCIVWHDGEKWRACLDTSLSKNLENEKFLTNFRDEHEYGIISNKFVYCITIRNDGNLVEVFFTDDFEHGTIVAHIASAYSQGEPDKDGLAPGAQIVLMDIMTGTCDFDRMENALLKCIEMKVDIVNLSVHFSGNYEILEIVNSMVKEHGIIFVRAAGNDGPVYSSIYEDEIGYINEMFNIGSINTPEMKCKLYDIQISDNEPLTVCSYSSRGPLSTGNRGITFSAPGASRISNPKWCSNSNETYHGTSFAAPIVTGSISCLLSALKANSIKYSPEMIKLALSNTAFLPEDGDELAFGNGIIQIEKAFEFIKTSLKNMSFDATAKISLTLPNAKDGIIFIKKEINQISKSYCINIKGGTKNIPWMLKTKQNKEKYIEYSKIIRNDKFTVIIDAGSLKPGSINYTEIQGINSLKPQMGVQFYLPITVIVPEKINEKTFQKEILLQHDNPYRFLFIPPYTSKKCIMKITALEEVETELFFHYCNADKVIKLNKLLQFTPKDRIQYCIIPVYPKKITEICIWFYDLLKETNVAHKFCLDFCFEKSCVRKFDSTKQIK